MAALALLLAAAWIGATFRSDMRAARERVSGRSTLVPTACGPIEYATAGTGPPLLVIHGTGGGFDQGLEFMQPLAGRGFTLVAPSRFGYLRTPFPQDASAEAQADAHACLLDALRIDALPVLGGSAGALSAMQLCIRHPQRCTSLVLLVPALTPQSPSGAPQPSLMAEWIIQTTLRSDLLFWLATHLARDTMIETILATPIESFRGASAAERRRVLEVLAHIQPLSLRAHGTWNDARLTSTPSVYPLERIRAPTLVVTSENDRFGTAASSRHIAQQVPGARLIVFPAGGHLGVGYQDETWDAVEAHLVRR